MAEKTRKGGNERELAFRGVPVRGRHAGPVDAGTRGTVAAPFAADWVAILAADCDEETFQQVMEQIG